MLQKIKTVTEFLINKFFGEDPIEEENISYSHQYQDDDEDIMLFVRLVNKANKDKQLRTSGRAQ